MEWVVDASGCEPARLADVDALRAVFDCVIADLDLRPAAEAQWKKFPPPGGVSGIVLLRESHLTCHSFPETGHAAFNLYCCRVRDPWPWERRLPELLAARSVVVRRIDRAST